MSLQFLRASRTRVTSFTETQTNVGSKWKGNNILKTKVCSLCTIAQQTKANSFPFLARNKKGNSVTHQPKPKFTVYESQENRRTRIVQGRDKLKTVRPSHRHLLSNLPNPLRSQRTPHGNQLSKRVMHSNFYCPPWRYRSNDR